MSDANKSPFGKAIAAASWEVRWRGVIFGLTGFSSPCDKLDEINVTALYGEDVGRQFLTVRQELGKLRKMMMEREGKG